jgi:hypothetical protein
MEEKGLFIIWLEKLFGKSWRTSLYGTIKFLSYSATGLQATLLQAGLHMPIWGIVATGVIGLIAGYIETLNSKDSAATGTNRPLGTGEPGEIK